MKKIPEWQYPLYKEWDKEFYRMIENLAKMKYPLIIGDQTEIDKFLKTMIRAQKMESWRTFFEIIQDDIKKNTFNITEINQKTTNLKIPKGIKSWAIFLSDKRVIIFGRILTVENTDHCKSISSIDCHDIFRVCGGIPKGNIKSIEGGTKKTVFKKII